MKALLLAVLLLVAGCGETAAVVAPPKSAPAATPAVPPCPESITEGGDPLESEGFEGKSVARVCLVGGSAASRKRVEGVTLLREGDPLAAHRVRADLDALLKLDVFEDAAAYGLRVQPGASVIVLYVVRDRPLVADIAFQGAKLLGDAALSAKLPIAKGSPYDPRRVHLVAQGVRDEYRARGYESCRVVLVTEPATVPAGAPAEVHVRIKVDEGVQWRIGKLDFRGNKKVTEADLRKVAALNVGQPFVQDEIERATLLLSALLYDRGLVAMHIETEQGATDANGHVPLTYVIDEGDVHTIGALHVTKLGAPLEKEILEKVVRARPKQVFARSSLVEDIARVKEFFAKRGQDVNVMPETEIDATKHTIVVTLAVEKP